ncbi:MAG TPA: hypothetical protein PK955_06270 [Methanoregulaceae archaeon]|nr:hypothetical protein [Methanoregulaceae archaeon]
MIEYFIISGMMMILIIITILTITPVAIYHPVDQLSEYAFIDIGNGVSTRIVDLYVIAPEEVGNITSKFDIPDDVVGREYEVAIESDESGDVVSVSYGNIRRVVPLAGIGETLEVRGNTTGHGLNVIQYNSTGWD